MRTPIAHGFTLPELLITLCLLAILLSVALPNLHQYLHSNRQENLRHSLLSHLKATRNDAITRMQRLEFCGSSNGQDCDQAWSNGWLIREPSSNTVLRYTQQPGHERLRWAGAGQANPSIVYLANGTTAASNGRFVLCNAEQRVAWQLVINRQGRVRQVIGLENGQNDSELCR
ncbi:MAG: GspH/FimT family pseudopilin [Pseudomonas sp.]